jgi:hypothetical protein
MAKKLQNHETTFIFFVVHLLRRMTNVSEKDKKNKIPSSARATVARHHHTTVASTDGSHPRGQERGATRALLFYAPFSPLSMPLQPPPPAVATTTTTHRCHLWTNGPK